MNGWRTLGPRTSEKKAQGDCVKNAPSLTKEANNRQGTNTNYCGLIHTCRSTDVKITASRLQSSLLQSLRNTSQCVHYLLLFRPLSGGSSEILTLAPLESSITFVSERLGRAVPPILYSQYSFPCLEHDTLTIPKFIFRVSPQMVH